MIDEKSDGGGDDDDDDDGADAFVATGPARVFVH